MPQFSSISFPYKVTDNFVLMVTSNSQTVKTVVVCKGDSAATSGNYLAPSAVINLTAEKFQALHDPIVGKEFKNPTDAVAAGALFEIYVHYVNDANKAIDIFVADPTTLDP